MPTAVEVVRDHRNHYLDRKLARSPLLHFFPGAYRIDINALFVGVQPNLPVVNPRDSGVSSPESLIHNLLGDRLDATIHNVRPAMLKRLERIQKAATDSIHSTGQHTLYVGYPCVVLPGVGGRTKLAPIFLFAVQIVTSAQKITIKRIVETAEDGTKTPSDAIFNRLLAAYIDREHGISLGADKHEIEITGAEIENKIDDIFGPWKTCVRSFEYPNTSSVPDRKYLKTLDSEGNDPYIAGYAILGLAEFTGQAMLDDLDKIIKMLDNGIESPEALTSLISAAKDNPNNEAAEPSGDYSKWLVEKSDPSQEKVVWAHKSNILTVLQGPPGTGKSQTIVNIVSDALAQKKTVLVVCQKRAAIEVVHKRLSAKGLGELAVLVDDVDKDRLREIRRIDQIDSEFGVSFSLRDRKKVSDEIQSDEAKIDKAIEALNDKKDGTRIRYGDIQARLKNLSFLEPSSQWTTRLKTGIEDYLSSGVDRKELDRFISYTKELDARAKRLRYGENLWSESSETLANDPQKRADTISHAKTANKLSKEFFDGAINLQHDLSTQWIAGHPWLQSSDSPFQASALLPSQEARQHFSEFQNWLGAIREISAFNLEKFPPLIQK
ncbi:MAG: AAA domain-containing protein [Nitrosomonadales bacterium]